MLDVPLIYKRIFRTRFRQNRSGRVVMTLLVRNEADILADWLEFHLAMGVDLILVIDNASVDGTRELLQAYERTGKVLHQYEPSDDYLQSLWVSRLAQRAFVEHGADWVINADADEFYVPTEGNLKTALHALDVDTDVISIKRHDTLPIEHSAVSNPVLRMIYRKRVSLEWVMQRPILDKIIHRGFPDVQVGAGAHGGKSKYFRKRIASDSIYTLHYPIRSWEQFYAKIRYTGINHKRNINYMSRYTVWTDALEQGESALRAKYSELCLMPDQIPGLLAAGDIVEDRRVVNVLAAL